MQIVNFLLSLTFIIIFLGIFVTLIITILKRKFTIMLREIHYSLWFAWMPILMNVLIFGISRFIMALFISIGDKMPPIITAFMFSFLCLVSIGIQLPFWMYSSIWMNIINIVMEIQNFLLSLICIICEVNGLTYDVNR